MSSRLLAALCLFLAVAAVRADEAEAPAQKKAERPAALEPNSPDFDPFDPRHKSYERHLAEVHKYHRLRPIRSMYAALHAVVVDPDRWEAYVKLVNFWPAHKMTLLREAYRRNARSDRLWRELEKHFSRPPVVKKFGTPTRLALLYVGRSNHDLDFDRSPRPSVEVGETLDPRRLIVQGLDASNDLVPADVVFEARGGLEVRQTSDGPRIVATEPAEKATLIATDRKSGTSAELHVRVIGPCARITVRTSGVQGKTRLGPGEMLHIRTGLFDAAGNRLWHGRLAWTARGKGGEKLNGLLARGYSWMHFDVTYEPHVQTLMAGRGGIDYSGPLTITAMEPESGATGKLTVTVSGEKEVVTRDHGGWAWRHDEAKAKAEAARVGRPYIIYFHATW